MGDRRPDDFYATPLGVVDTLVNAMCWHDLAGVRVFDPSAGDGAILDSIRLYGVAQTMGIELEEGRAAQARSKGHVVATGDSLTATWPKAEVLIQNAPFIHVLAFAEKAAEWAQRTGGIAASLVRLSFLSSKGRVWFHHKWPHRAIVLGGRPSFTGDGKTDSVDYAWIVTGRGEARIWCVEPLVSTDEAARMRKVAA